MFWDYTNDWKSGCCFFKPVSVDQICKALKAIKKKGFVGPDNLDQWFSNFLQQVPPQKIFGSQSIAIMTNSKIQKCKRPNYSELFETK